MPTRARRDAQVSVRLRPDDREALESLAESMGLAVAELTFGVLTDFLRSCLDRQAGEGVPRSVAVARQILADHAARNAS